MKIPATILAAFALAASAAANDDFVLDPHDDDRLANLRGKWRFSVGDDIRWAAPSFDDRSWTQINAPEEWESEGYRSYNGFAWYRKSFKLPDDADTTQTYLHLGTIDDVDEVYLNGQLIGSSGQFPPDFRTAYSHSRSYLVPPKLLKPGQQNLVAVRVYDEGGKGGIDSGMLGLYAAALPILQVELSGSWLFRQGDDAAWAATQLDESDFQSIHAPATWESQGFPDYDGFAWYRKSFDFDPALIPPPPAATASSDLERSAQPDTSATMVLLLGRIDDFDEVFLNGVKIGGTGELNPPNDDRGNELYNQSRGYYFPAYLLRERNTIAVRVYDRWGVGGIYAGPLGIVSQADYIAYWENKRKSQSVLKDIRRLFY